MDIYRPEQQAATLGRRVDMRAVMKEVYLWMTLGLLTSAVVAAVFVVTDLTTILMGPGLLIAFAIELGLVFYLAARLGKMSAQRAATLFLLYAAVNGATLSLIFFTIALADIYLALFATGAMFAAMSMIGYTTEIDLTRFRGLFLMALIGLVIAMVINLFVASSGLYWLVSIAGVLIFTGLTAYDTQWIKRNAAQMEAHGVGQGDTLVRRVAIMGALKLYLDFVNLFLFILRMTSRRS